MILNPLSQVAIYSLILSNVLAARLPGVQNEYAYSVYLIAGLLGWGLFTEVLGRNVTLFVDKGSEIKKIAFPKITLPVIVLGSGVINNLMLFVSIVFVLALLGYPMTLQLFWLLPLTILTVAFASGLGVALGILNVFLRDVSQVVPIVLQIWFWMTPIVYPIDIIPEKARYLLEYNPMYQVISGYQNVIVYGRAPEFSSFLPVCIATAFFLLLGLFLFRRASHEMVDVL
jgi:lipopolysaccharide transport system permease protein